MIPLRKLLIKMANSLVGRKYKNRPFTVIIEGNIGSGKTTFLNHFKKYDNVCVLAEPIQMWRNCKGYNLMELMYKDTTKWGFSFQSYVQLTMLQQHTSPTPCPVKLMERSIYSARYCFVEKMGKEGIIPAPSFEVLDEWFKWVTTNADCSIDLIVYLRTSPEVVYQRMLERNRQEERSVSFEYLKQLHEIHENWLYHKTIFTCPAPVITLDANLDKLTIIEEYEKFEPRILNKVSLQMQA